MFRRFNGFVRSVILGVSEARDLGEHMKIYLAAPPDVLRCDEKNLREYSVPNVCGVIITTNHKTDGIYLPADDRRHYVAWSDATKENFTSDYWTSLYGWYEDEGYRNVVAYLTQLNLAGFNSKAPPRTTFAFHAIVDANRAPEDADLADTLDAIAQNGRPVAVTIPMLIAAATGDFQCDVVVVWRCVAGPLARDIVELGNRCLAVASVAEAQDGERYAGYRCRPCHCASEPRRVRKPRGRCRESRLRPSVDELAVRRRPHRLRRRARSR
jgi:hypothetical protein